MKGRIRTAVAGGLLVSAATLVAVQLLVGAVMDMVIGTVLVALIALAFSAGSRLNR